MSAIPFDNSDFEPACALPSLQALQAANPCALGVELRRFARKKPKKPKDAVALYSDYLQWRSAKGSPASLAHAYSIIPSCLFSGIDCQGPAKDGTPVIFVELARCDVGAHSDETYALGLAHLMDQAFRRDEEGHFTVVCDTRPGDGLPNPAPGKITGFLRELVHVARMFPDRMRRIIVYPVPWWAGMFVKMVKSMLDEQAKDKLYIIPGNHNTLDCPDALAEFITIESIPARSWHRHRSLGPAKTACNVSSVSTTCDSHDADDDEFYSASEGGGDRAELEELLDLESGLLLPVAPSEEPQQPSRARCVQRWPAPPAWWPFRCRLCRHRARHGL
eukprot:TRINITY_DN12126_c0_g1_i2.p1 TRINITY_DN12126_c0_g1~~TRINITY_DN12126_c0_g1_i2.p1  ORF type:complete len:333 (-),score=44.40 TRINITY_DN12126_c0_g1_i2:142-1140(-)